MDNDEIRLGVLGAGLMGASHARRITESVPGARVAVVADIDETRAAAISAEIVGCSWTTEPLQVIESGEVDAVVIATPASSHEKLTTVAIERGMPVFCEKPLGESAESARRVVERERASGRQLVQLGFMRRFDREYAEVHDRIADGEIGTPLTVSTVVRVTSVPPAFTSEMIINDSAVHDFDMTRFLLGEEVASVTVRKGKVTPRAHDGLDDPLLIVAQTVSGALSVISLCVSSGMPYETRTEVLGSEGALEAGIEGGVLARTTAGTRVQRGIPSFLDRFADAYTRELRSFVDGVRAGRVTGPGSWDGYAAAAVCEAGVRSLASGEEAAVEMVKRP